jgi:hypothetical protein
VPIGMDKIQGIPKFIESYDKRNPERVLNPFRVRLIYHIIKTEIPPAIAGRISSPSLNRAFHFLFFFFVVVNLFHHGADNIKHSLKIRVSFSGYDKHPVNYDNFRLKLY